MKTKDQIILDIDTINQFSNEFLSTSNLNPFYNKNIYLSQGLRTIKYTEFQILGNLGGWANDYEFNTQTDFYVIADSIIHDLKNGKKDNQLSLLEMKINDKGKKYENLKIIHETAFLIQVKKLCDTLGDNATLNLLKRISMD